MWSLPVSYCVDEALWLVFVFSRFMFVSILISFSISICHKDRFVAMKPFGENEWGEV